MADFRLISNLPADYNKAESAPDSKSCGAISEQQRLINSEKHLREAYDEFIDAYPDNNQLLNPIASTLTAKDNWFFYQGDKLISFFSIDEAPLLHAFRHGVMMVLPLLLAGAVAILINQFPLQAYQTLMSVTFGPNWKDPGVLIYNSTIEIMALAVTFSLSQCLIDLHNQRHPGQGILPSIGVLTAFSCLFLAMAPQTSTHGLVLAWAGIRGLFGSLLITLLACKIFLNLCQIKRLRVPFYSEGSDPVLPHLFDALLPSIITMGIFVFFRELLVFFGIDSLHQALYEAIRAPFMGATESFTLGALYAFLIEVCWFFGIHGADLLDPITHDILLKGVEINIDALNNHLPPPYILTKYFFEVYVFMGGSGATLGLLLAIFLSSKDGGTKRVASLSLVPGLFNINELLLFGLPIVLNPAFLIPFLFIPLILTATSFIAVLTDIAPQPVFQTDWTTPPFINAFVATGSWRGIILQLFNLALATAIYTPFVLLSDREKLKNRRNSFAALVSIAAAKIRGPNSKYCTDRPGNPGALARSLANDMQRSLDAKDDNIFLHYQPRVDYVNKKVPCVEALLRWRHPAYGPIPPVLALAIAEDADLLRRLDAFVLRKAFEQQYEWRTQDVTTCISINLSEEQLRHKEFPALISHLLATNNFPADAVAFEVGEATALDSEGRYNSSILALKGAGVRIIVDDFGRGYQTMSRLKQVPISEIQIDRSLTRGIEKSKTNQDIIAAIQEMCYSLEIIASAEFVENKEQLEMLLELNFSIFQGHFFSKPLPPDKCREYILSFSET